jgi:hypothetical protein
MKHFKPGQIVTIRNHIYRVKKRIFHCNGCALDNIFMCPMIRDSRDIFNDDFNCGIDNVIFVRI